MLPGQIGRDGICHCLRTVLSSVIVLFSATSAALLVLALALAIGIAIGAGSIFETAFCFVS